MTHMPLVSDERARALRAEVLATCVEVMHTLRQDEFASAQDLDYWQPVVAVVYAALQQHAREQTAIQSAISKLPDELLVETLSHLGLWDRIRATNVCHRWRTVSLGAPGRLWSRIPGLANLYIWEMLLIRAGAAPVLLEDVHIYKNNINVVFAILERHIHHIKSLNLAPTVGDDSDGPDDVSDDEWHALLDDIFAMEAPILEHVAVYRQMSRRRELPILGSPRLRSAILYDCPLACLASSSALTALIIEVSTDRVFPAQHWPLLSSFPALEVLGVKLENGPRDSSYEPVEAPPLSLSVPRTMLHLRLELPYRVFRSLVDSPLPSMAHVPIWEFGFTDYDLPETPQDVLLPLRPGPIQHLALSFAHNITFMITERTSEQRIVRHVEFDEAWLSETLAGVETLCCFFPPRFWTHDPLAQVLDASLALAALQDLTFDLSELPTYGRNNNARDCEFRWPYGACPALRAVRVRAYGLAARVKLRAVITVLGLLTDSASDCTPRRKLYLLDFDNVSVVSHTEEDALRSLEEFSETVSMRTDGHSWPECHCFWNTPWEVLIWGRPVV